MEYSTFRPADMGDVLSLVKKTFGARAPSRRWWYHRYLSPPGRPSDFVVARHYHKLVGVLALDYVDGITPRGPLSMVVLNPPLVDPELASDTSIAVGLYREAKTVAARAGAEVITAAVPGREAADVAERVGLTELGALPTRIKLLEPAVLLGEGRVAEVASSMAKRLLELGAPSLAQEGVAVEEVEGTDPVRTTWRPLVADGVARCRSQAYLIWRYLRDPFLPYKVLVTRQSGAISGYVTVAPVIEGDLTALVIADMAFVRSPSVVRALVGQVVDLAVQAGVGAVVGACTNPLGDEILAEAGFVTSRWSPVDLDYRVLVDRPEPFVEHGAWYLTLADVMDVPLTMSLVKSR